MPVHISSAVYVCIKFTRLITYIYTNIYVCLCMYKIRVYNLKAYPRSIHTPIFLTSRSYLDLHSNTLQPYCSSARFAQTNCFYIRKPKLSPLINTWRGSGFRYVGDNTIVILKQFAAQIILCCITCDLTDVCNCKCPASHRQRGGEGTSWRLHLLLYMLNDLLVRKHKSWVLLNFRNMCSLMRNISLISVCSLQICA